MTREKAIEYLLSRESYFVNYVQKNTGRSKEESYDIFMDAVEKILNRFHTFDENKFKFNTWAHRVIRNTGIDFLRKKKNQIHSSVLLDNWQGEEGETLERTDENLIVSPDSPEIDADLIRDLIHKELKPKQIMAFVLRYNGYQYQEAADMLEMPIGTYKALLWHAKNILQEAIRDLYKINLDEHQESTSS